MIHSIISRLQHLSSQQGLPFEPLSVHVFYISVDLHIYYGRSSTPETDPHIIIVVADLEKLQICPEYFSLRL